MQYPAGGGSPIKPFANGIHGYMGLRQTKTEMGKTWARETSRYMNYRGLLSTLESILRDDVSKKDRSLPGKLVIKEFVYDEDFCDLDNEETAPYFKQLDQKILDEDERIESFVKRDGGEEHAPTLKVGDYPILKFTEYDDTRQDSDVFVTYDNVEDVAEYREEYADEIAAHRLSRNKVTA